MKIFSFIYAASALGKHILVLSNFFCKRTIFFNCAISTLQTKYIKIPIIGQARLIRRKLLFKWCMVNHGEELIPVQYKDNNVGPRRYEFSLTFLIPDILRLQCVKY